MMGGARRPMLASFAEKYTLLIVNMAASMVLARLLAPAEVGVYALGAVMVALAQVLRDFGVGAYLVQEKTLSRETWRAAFGISLLVGWLLAALVFAASWPVSAFYSEPRLRLVLQLLSIHFLLLPFSALTMSCLRRQLRFGAIFTINASQACVQTLCAIWLAWRGHGYLSLVYGALAGAVAGWLAGLCHRPQQLPCLPGWRGMRKIWRFGAVATGGTLIDEAGVAAPELIIGKLMGVSEVAIFGKATAVINVFNQLVTAALSPVLFPLFSAQAREGHDVRRAYLLTARCMTALAWPFFGFVALMAPALVQLLYGAQWLAAVPLIRVLCLAAAVYSVFSMARYLLVALGDVKGQARLDATAVPLRIAALWLAAPYGLWWVAWAVVLGALFRSWLTLRALRRLVGLSAVLDLATLWDAVRHSALIALVSLCGPLAALLFISAGAAAQLLVAALGALVLWILTAAWLRHELAAECLRAFRKLLLLLSLSPK